MDRIIFIVNAYFLFILDYLLQIFWKLLTHKKYIAGISDFDKSIYNQSTKNHLSINYVNTCFICFATCILLVNLH